MDVLSVMRLLWRRKLVVLLASLVVVAALVFTVTTVPPVYRASSSVVLLNPPAPPASEVEGASSDVIRSLDNPFERFNDLSVVVDILRRIMNSGPTRDALEEQGLLGTYTVAANIDFYRGPIVDVAAEAGSEVDALRSTELVMSMLEETLRDLQVRQGTSTDYLITSDVVVPATRATQVFSSTLRRLIAVGALGVMFVFGSVLAVDAILARRRKPFESQEPVVRVLQSEPGSDVDRPKGLSDHPQLRNGESK